MSILSAFVSACVSAFVAIQQPPAVVSEDVVLYADRIEFVKEFDDETVEREGFFVPFAMESDPITIDDCLATAQIACASTGIKRFLYRTNHVTGDVTCEFECNPGTGSGG